MHPPDVLVLGAGGALAEAWMRGVLAGVAAETGIDFRSTESIVGTSAGAIVAAGLVAGRDPGGDWSPDGGDEGGLADAGEPAAGRSPNSGHESGPDAARESNADRSPSGGHESGPYAASGANADRSPNGGHESGADAASEPNADRSPSGGDEGDHDAADDPDVARPVGASDDDDDPDAADEGGVGAVAARIAGVIAGPLGTVGRGAGRLARGAGATAARPLTPLALSATGPVGALVRAGVLGRIPPPRATLDELGARIERDGLRFDGRLRVVAVERERGRRVVFGAPGAPRATVAQAVQASCTVPWLYRPVRIGEHEYVDGGLWSPTSIDVAPALRDTHVLCLNPTAAASGDRAPHAAIRAASRSAATLEAAVLRRRGAQVTILGPDRPAAAALAGPAGVPGPAEDAAALAFQAGWRQGVDLARA